MAITDVKTVAEFKGPRSNEKRVVKITDYGNGNPKRVDIRVSYEDEDGNWRFTRQGLNFKPDEVDALIKALTAAKKDLA